MGSLAAIDTELPPPRVESYAIVGTRHQGSASAALRGQWVRGRPLLFLFA